MGFKAMQSAATAMTSQAAIMSTSSTRKRKQTLAPQQSLHFYKNDQLATEVAVNGNRHVLWANDVALAQLAKSRTAEMLRVDHANSVLGLASGSVAYSPYGYLATEKLHALLGFNGQWCDPLTQGYPLGAGRRIYNPSLMRFCSNDKLSPFEKGGLHPSAYCGGDPINQLDPTGEFRVTMLQKPIAVVQNGLRQIRAATAKFGTYGFHSPKSTPHFFDTPQSSTTSRAINASPLSERQPQLLPGTTSSSPAINYTAASSIISAPTPSASNTVMPRNHANHSSQNTKPKVSRRYYDDDDFKGPGIVKVFQELTGLALAGVGIWLLVKKSREG